MSRRPARWYPTGRCCPTPRPTRRSGRSSPTLIGEDPAAARCGAAAVGSHSCPELAQRGHGDQPPGAPKPAGAWGLGSRAGDLLFLAGMQGFGPDGKLSPDPETRIRQAFLNIKALAESEGAGLHDCVRVTVYLSDLHRYAGLVDKVQAELWAGPPYPPRTMVEVQRLFDDDIIEVDTVFYAPRKKK